MSAKAEPLLTIDDLDALPEDGNHYELIEGELFVSRAPSLAHQIIVSNLIAVFRDYLHQKPIGIIVPGPGLIFSNFSGVIPDVVFISRERRDEIASGDRLSGAPDIVIEIVSPGAEDERRDRVVKRQLYGKYGVHEYWIVDPQTRTLEIYRLRRRTLKLVTTLVDEDEVTSPILPGFRYRVSQIFSE